MRAEEWVFWVCLFFLVYGYLIYPVLLFLAYSFSQVVRDWQYLGGRRNRRARTPRAEGLPCLSVIFPAYNEEAHLPDKLANLRQLDYPREKLEVVIVSDGSTDRTNAILQGLNDSSIRVSLLPERKGKFNALNHAVSLARHDLFVFCDAPTLFEPLALVNLVRHFANPQVGVVAGALQFRGTEEFHQTEGVYWKYESILRLMEARLGLTLTASGAIYALRRACYRFLTAEDVIEDLLIPMQARRLGFRVLYDPEAVGYEIASPSVRGEFARKARFAVGGFSSLRGLTQAALESSLGVALVFISHKLLRWGCPFFLLGLLVSNAFLLGGTFFRVTLGAQILFYLWAAIGFVFRERMQKVRFALLGYFLVAMNVAMAVGFFRFLARREETLWQRAQV